MLQEIVAVLRFRCLSEEARLYRLSGSDSPGLPFSGFPVFQTPACYPQNLFSTGNSSRRLSSSPGPLPLHSPPPQIPREKELAPFIKASPGVTGLFDSQGAEQHSGSPPERSCALQRLRTDGSLGETAEVSGGAIPRASPPITFLRFRRAGNQIPSTHPTGFLSPR